MAKKNIRMRPEGTNDYGDTLHPETNASVVELASSNFTATNVEAGMDELFQNVSNGKQVVAAAITGKGQSTSSSATFATMATNIGKIETQSVLTGNAVAANVLTGKTFYSNNPKIISYG